MSPMQRTCHGCLFEQRHGPGTGCRAGVQATLQMWLVRKFEGLDGRSTLGRMLVATCVNWAAVGNETRMTIPGTGSELLRDRVERFGLVSCDFWGHVQQQF